jgi:DNA mismatch repair ATPase MutS
MESDEEFEVRKKLTGEVERYSQLLLKNAENIGRLDLLFAKARLAVALKCTKPRIIKENVISIQQGRHPVVEEALKEKGLEFKPVDIYLSKPVTVITGANMGGKTVTLKMVGLLVAMGQMGLLVPAGEMFFSPRDFVFFSGSYGESLEDGLSAFGAEIKALSQVLNHIDKRGLVLIDELARGTNPLEGTAIARAVVARLVAGRCISIATTHFYEVSKLPGVVHLQVRGLKGVKAEKIKDELENGKTIGPELLNRIMDYTLEEVSADALPSHDAIKVARMMGFDEGTLKNAERFIKQEGEE